MDKQQQIRYNERMKRKKVIVDASIARATEERGILILLRGNGKGKSSSAFGTMARMVGHGKKVAVIQFIKGKEATGEYTFFHQHPLIDWHIMGHGFTWETQDFKADSQAALKAWKLAKQRLQDERYAMIILDEMTYPLKYNNIPIEPVIKALKNRPHQQTIIITGRAMPKGLVDIADTISTIQDDRHAFRLGVKAQAGIEY